MTVYVSQYGNGEEFSVIKWTYGLPKGPFSLMLILPKEQKLESMDSCMRHHITYHHIVTWPDPFPFDGTPFFLRNPDQSTICPFVSPFKTFTLSWFLWWWVSPTRERVSVCQLFTSLGLKKFRGKRFRNDKRHTWYNKPLRYHKIDPEVPFSTESEKSPLL